MRLPSSRVCVSLRLIWSGDVAEGRSAHSLRNFPYHERSLGLLGGDERTRKEDAGCPTEAVPDPPAVAGRQSVPSPWPSGSVSRAARLTVDS